MLYKLFVFSLSLMFVGLTVMSRSAAGFARAAVGKPRPRTPASLGLALSDRRLSRGNRDEAKVKSFTLN